MTRNKHEQERPFTFTVSALAVSVASSLRETAKLKRDVLEKADKSLQAVFTYSGGYLAMRCRSSGLTQLDLLASICLIAIFLGLLIPAINSSKGPARTNQCATNMRNVALAAIEHDSSKGSFPA